MSKPQVSVIVPVYNHWDRMPHLIACLAAQTFPLAQFELLIVDNGSDHLPPVAGLPPWARLLHCAAPGSYAARNVAIAEARGNVLAFTDADCRPEPGWIAAGLTCLERSGGHALAAGDIRIVPELEYAPTPYEVYDMMLGLPQRRYVERGYAITANLFVPHAVFGEVGLFDARRFSGGDADLCRRAVAAGHGLIFCEQSVVVHPARRAWDELVVKAKRIKGGQIMAGPLMRRLGWVFRTFVPPVSVWRIVLRARSFTWRQRLMVCMIKTRLWGVEILEMLHLLTGREPGRR
ncbi:MAG TPA: glycosyltransferase [Thiobacillus sp.]|nr:glycosyltransferase [Thiobacillus sp.]